MKQASNGGGRWRSTPWRVAAWSSAAVLMLVPIGVELTSGPFGWSLGDFVFVAVTLFTGCLIFDVAARAAPNFAYLAGCAAALAAGFGLFVVNGAVGLVGSENEAHNLLFMGAVVVAIGGSAVARARPAGLARAMLAAAFVHSVVSTALLLRAGGASDGDPRMEIVGLSVFAAMWLGSAWLFQRASATDAGSTGANDG